ncbi:zinc finger protein OZF-like isoform X2 [Corythoichthys intestinalis]|uniref:zinc finger protein OZF-like isoform X2 n=1 Tax=Corythoichthys intestinalis TaxID=161448 RepID=UPI0025A59AF6|nr:zinc finger protein OZF-like isoform X2 [Corythoichthys intestinalis]
MDGATWDDADPQYSQLHYIQNVLQPLAREKEVPREQLKCLSRVKQEDPKPQHIKEESDLFQNKEHTKCSLTGHQKSQLNCSEREMKHMAEHLTSSSTTEAGENDRSGLELDTELGTPSRDEIVISDPSVCVKAEEPVKSERDSKYDTSNAQYKIFCPICCQKFILRSFLTKHVKLTHVTTHKTATGGETFSCSVCGKHLSKMREVTQHIKIHAPEKVYCCSECGKRFGLKHNYFTHMKLHAGEFPFPCSVCGKRFSNKSNLCIHMRKHTGEKPFSCSVCSKSFSSQPAAQVHLRTHTGEKPYSCSVCMVGFTCMAHLQRHMRTHTGERPFACSICGAMFVQKVHLVVHQRTHAEKKLSCGLCYKKFTCQQEADNHKCTGENSSRT